MRWCCLFSQIYKEKLLDCLCGYFSSLKWLVWWLLLKVSCVLYAFSIPISSAYSCFHYRLHHHQPCPCSISSAHSGMVQAYRNRRSSVSPPRSAAAQFPSYSFKPGRMQRRTQGVEGRGGGQRSYSLCLQSDPIYLLIFLHLHPPFFLFRLVLGYWWEWKEHCLLLGTLQLLQSWEADTRINRLLERLAEISLSLAKMSEKVRGSRVIGRAALALAKIHHLPKIHETWQPG